MWRCRGSARLRGRLGGCRRHAGAEQGQPQGEQESQAHTSDSIWHDGDMAAARNWTPLNHDARHHCLGCGVENRIGLKLKFFLDPERGGVVCRLRLPLRFQGPHGLAHGGIIATVLDEAMSKAVHASGVIAMTRHIEVDYLRPVALGASLELRSRVVSVEGRKHFCEGVLSGGERELARGKALFIAVPQWLDAVAPPAQPEQP